jgi:large subunit ribosomal protein L10e
MVALRKASAYSKRKVVPYTRISKKKQKSYIKAVPPQKIVKFSMGNEPLFKQGKFPHELTLISAEAVQIRHNALEACRQFINKKLDVELAGQYYFRVIPFPHHIQRENKMLTGAGADRMQTGMQLSFGKTMGKSAIMKKGGRIFFVAVPNQKALNYIRHALRQIKAKLPGKTSFIYVDHSREKPVSSDVTVE